MAHPFRVVTINGSHQAPSKTGVVLDAIVARVGEQLPIERHSVDVTNLLGQPLAASIDTASAGLREDVHAIETADLIVAGSPVYKGSYTGLFKYVLDLVDQYALIDVPAILVATGGSERHTLVVEHQLRPLFGFFQTATNPLGIYAHSGDFENYVITSPALEARIARSADRAVSAVEGGITLRELNSSSL